MVKDSSDRRSSIRGKVVSKRENPLGGVKVECSGRTATTLSDGTFQLNDMEVTEHLLTASLKGFQTESVNISLKETDDLFLELNLLDAKGNGTIYGNVYDDNNMLVTSGGTVILLLPASNQYAQMNHQGRYEFKNLPPDKYAIHTSIPHHRDLSVQVTVEKGAKKRHDFYCKRANEEEVDPPWG